MPQTIVVGASSSRSRARLDPPERVAEVVGDRQHRVEHLAHRERVAPRRSDQLVLADHRARLRRGLGRDLDVRRQDRVRHPGAVADRGSPRAGPSRRRSLPPPPRSPRRAPRADRPRRRPRPRRRRRSGRAPDVASGLTSAALGDRTPLRRAARRRPRSTRRSRMSQLACRKRVGGADVDPVAVEADPVEPLADQRREDLALDRDLAVRRDQLEHRALEHVGAGVDLAARRSARARASRGTR